MTDERETLSPIITSQLVFNSVVFSFECHSGPLKRPDRDPKESKARQHHQRKQQRGRSPPHRERKWSGSGRNVDRNIADVKIELGPMPFDPKY